VVYAASSSSYGIPEEHPTSESSPILPQYPYALTKHRGEKLVLHWSQVYHFAVSLRLFNVYGPRSRTSGAYGVVFGVFLAQKIKQPALHCGGRRWAESRFYLCDRCRGCVRPSRRIRIAHWIPGGSEFVWKKYILFEIWQRWGIQYLGWITLLKLL